MTISALALYGSRARKDHADTSDVDLFAISETGSYQMVVREKTNLAIYPLALAEKMALRGDLFMLHIVTEGKPIFDPLHIFKKLNSLFCYKKSYGSEIDHASELGWALIRLAAEIENFTIINRRIAWCVRTILIARSAEQQNPIFSSRELADFAEDGNVVRLIKNKDNNRRDSGLLNAFSKFLLRHAGQQSTWVKSNITDFDEILKHFQDTENEVGVKTLKLVRTQVDPDFLY